MPNVRRLSTPTLNMLTSLEANAEVLAVFGVAGILGWGYIVLLGMAAEARTALREELKRRKRC